MIIKIQKRENFDNSLIVKQLAIYKLFKSFGYKKRRQRVRISIQLANILKKTVINN